MGCARSIPVTMAPMCSLTFSIFIDWAVILDAAALMISLLISRPADGDSAPSGFCVFQAEAVAPAPDMADRGRREVHRAAQRVGVAVALEEIPARPDSLVAVGVDAHDQIGVAGLDGRMDQIAGEHRGVG